MTSQEETIIEQPELPAVLLGGPPDFTSPEVQEAIARDNSEAKARDDNMRDFRKDKTYEPPNPFLLFNRVKTKSTPLGSAARGTFVVADPVLDPYPSGTEVEFSITGVNESNSFFWMINGLSAGETGPTLTINVSSAYVIDNDMDGTGIFTISVAIAGGNGLIVLAGTYNMTYP
jgi:hypothetical protein